MREKSQARENADGFEGLNGHLKSTKKDSKENRKKSMTSEESEDGLFLFDESFEIEDFDSHFFRNYYNQKYKF